MSYVVLARKHRPQTFEDLVGQTPVSQTLRNALESGRIAHAYIFSGPRGIGKTTTARLLAKCLNCEKGPSITPCNACDSCVTIAEGNSIDDVLEIDGASNRGIDQIRDLRDNAKYAPAKSRYRIYIIDEAHQITKDAFGALLKTLEEPPSHVVFMMATTEVHKIPAPILSRCQRFSLRPISPDLVFKHLKDICAREKAEVDDAALKHIVRFVEGSLRDALSLLDQAFVFAAGRVTTEALRDLLGLLPAQTVTAVAEAIEAGDPASVLKKISECANGGVDLTQLGKDLQGHYHALMLAKAGVDDPLAAHEDAFFDAAGRIDFGTLERNVRLLARALEEMRRSDSPRAVFELCILRMAQKTLDARTLLERLERLESAAGNAPSPPGYAGAPKSAPSAPAGAPRGPRASASAIGFSAPTAAPAVAPAPARLPVTPAMAAPPSEAIDEPMTEEEPPPVDDAFVDDDGEPDMAGGGERWRAAWPAVVAEVEQERQSAGAALREAVLSGDANGVVLTFSNAFNQHLVERVKDRLVQALRARTGLALVVATRVDTSRAAPRPAPQTPTAAFEPPPLDGPTIEEVPEGEIPPDVRTVLRHFPGTLKRRSHSE